MALTSLLVCADAKAVQVLKRILQDLSISVEHCSDPPAAVTRLSVQRYDAVLVDCVDEQAAGELFLAARKTTLNRAILGVAIVDDQNHVREVFNKGANFVLYKPISQERAAASLRAARSLMRRERRSKQRIPLHAEASIAYADTENAPATLVDMSEDGVAIQSGRRLPPTCKVYFQFSLPGQVSIIRLSGQVTWQDSSGRVGIRFADVPQSSRRVLSDWLKANVSKKSEEAGSLTTGSEQSAGQPVTVQSVDLGPLSASDADRRIVSRRPCRLGAEVYRTGSNVPTRCNLTDLGPGGCYVETTEPFAVESSVEIVVRTNNVKLRVRGTVKVMHPGFGMGVRFTMSTADQRSQVQQLLACQEQVPEVSI